MLLEEDTVFPWCAEYIKDLNRVCHMVVRQVRNQNAIGVQLDRKTSDGKKKRKPESECLGGEQGINDVEISGGIIEQR